MTFKATKVGEHLRIQAESGYSLLVIDSEPMDWVSITFDLPILNHKEVMVTGRDIKDYHPQIKDISIDPSKVYLEVGAGLGEFIHVVVQQNPLQKPIVVDPADYTLMLKMLEGAEEFSLREETRQRLQIYQQRCRTILNPNQVQLINSSLEQAVGNLELRKIADIVIDHYAAAYHSSDHEATTAMELRLLKPQGKLYSFLSQR